MKQKNKTLTVLKHGCVGTALEDFTKKRLSEAGFRITAELLLQLTQPEGAEWYINKKDEVPENIYNLISENISAGPIKGLMLERDDNLPAWQVVRLLAGDKDPKIAATQRVPDWLCEKLELPLGTKTIRGEAYEKFGEEACNLDFNLIHSADSEQNLYRETLLFMKALTMRLTVKDVLPEIEPPIVKSKVTA